MGRMYAVVDTGTLFGTAAGDMIQIVAAADKPILIHSLEVSAQTETDDNAVLALSRWTNAGSGGVSLDAHPLVDEEVVDSATILGRNTDDANAGEERIWAAGMSLLAGITKIWTPETRPLIVGGGNLVLSTLNALTTDATFTVVIEFEEIG